MSIMVEYNPPRAKDPGRSLEGYNKQHESTSQFYLLILYNLLKLNLNYDMIVLVKKGRFQTYFQLKG